MSIRLFSPVVAVLICSNLPQHVVISNNLSSFAVTRFQSPSVSVMSCWRDRDDPLFQDGLTQSLRELPWVNSRDPDTFYPRSYVLSDDEKGAIEGRLLFHDSIMYCQQRICEIVESESVSEREVRGSVKRERWRKERDEREKERERERETDRQTDREREREDRKREREKERKREREKERKREREKERKRERERETDI